MSKSHTDKAEALLVWMEQTLRQNSGKELPFGWNDVVMGYIELAKVDEMAQQTGTINWIGMQLNDLTNEIVSEGYLSVKFVKE